MSYDWNKTATLYDIEADNFVKKDIYLEHGDVIKMNGFYSGVIHRTDMLNWKIKIIESDDDFLDIPKEIFDNVTDGLKKYNTFDNICMACPLNNNDKFIVDKFGFGLPEDMHIILVLNSCYINDIIIKNQNFEIKLDHEEWDLITFEILQSRISEPQKIIRVDVCVENEDYIKFKERFGPKYRLAFAQLPFCHVEPQGSSETRTKLNRSWDIHTPISKIYDTIQKINTFFFPVSVKIFYD